MTVNSTRSVTPGQLDGHHVHPPHHPARQPEERRGAATSRGRRPAGEAPNFSRPTQARVRATRTPAFPSEGYLAHLLPALPGTGPVNESFQVETALLRTIIVRCFIEVTVGAIDATVGYAPRTAP
jgi:hypothetical protein